jgi:hypothetical protein
VVLVKWDEGPNSYAVVGRMSSEELVQLASRVDVAALGNGVRLAAGAP